MHIPAHLEKIERFELARSRLDPLEDFELWFWATMMAGTNAVNAALHHTGLTPAEAAYPSQPGVYHVALPQGGHEPRLKASGDVLHVGRPPVPGPVPPDIQRMMDAMERIEQYRDPCTRGDMHITPQVVSECADAYDECLRLLGARMEGH